MSGAAEPGSRTDLLEELAGPALAHRDRVDPAQGVAHQGAGGLVVERPRAHRVDQHRDVLLLGERDFPEVHRRGVVVEDAAPAQDEQVELGDLRQHLVARQVAHRHRPLHLVARRGVLDVAGEDGDLAGHRGPELRDDGL
jgi:hypothetical protein